jgi:LysR family hydrogen peroxide-inducible transcriptional activator
MKAAPSIRQLRHLVALADRRHFRRAAEACLVTQSTLSASIKSLETLLGAVLVERTRRSVMMTPLGDDIAARARAILSEVDDLVDRVEASGAPLAGELRLGVIPTIGPYLLPRVLPALRAAHPALRLYLREEQTAPLLERLAGGDLDALLLAFPYPARKIATFVFADDPFWVAFPKGHSFARCERISPAQLAGEPLLLLEEGHCLRDHALGACDLVNDREPDGFQATSLETLVQMVDNGLGLTLLPKMAIDAGIARGTKLEARPLLDPAGGRNIGLAWRESSSRGEEFTLLATFFRDELATPLAPPRRTG